MCVFFAHILSDFINNNEPQVQIVANLNSNKQITEESETKRNENAMPNNDDREERKKHTTIREMNEQRKGWVCVCEKYMMMICLIYTEMSSSGK